MAKNLISSPVCAPLAQIWAPNTSLDVRHCRKLSLYAILWKTYDPNSRNWQKKLILGLA